MIQVWEKIQDIEFANERVRQNEEYLENKSLTCQHMVEFLTKQGKFQRGSSHIPQPKTAQKSDFPQDKISEVERAETKPSIDVRVANEMAARRFISKSRSAREKR